MSGEKSIVEAVKDLTDAKIRDILFRVLEVYCHPSFGSISKREFEIILFGELYRNGVLGKDVYEISRKLRISTSRVKSLIYEYELRYEDKNSLDKQLKNCLLKALVDKAEDDDWLLVYIESPYIQEYIQKLIRESGFIWDTTFNKSLLKIRKEAYSYLLATKLTPEEVENLKRKIENKAIKETEKEYKDWLEMIRKKAPYLADVIIYILTALKYGTDIFANLK